MQMNHAAFARSPALREMLCARICRLHKLRHFRLEMIAGDPVLAHIPHVIR